MGREQRAQQAAFIGDRSINEFGPAHESLASLYRWKHPERILKSNGQRRSQKTEKVGTERVNIPKGILKESFRESLKEEGERWGVNVRSFCRPLVIRPRSRVAPPLLLFILILVRLFLGRLLVRLLTQY